MALAEQPASQRSSGPGAWLGLKRLLHGAQLVAARLDDVPATLAVL
jgi:hypothetical protein